MPACAGTARLSAFSRVFVGESVLSVEEQQLLDNARIFDLVTADVFDLAFRLTEQIRPLSVEGNVLSRSGHSPTSIRFPSAPTWSHSGS